MFRTTLSNSTRQLFLLFTYLNGINSEAYPHKLSSLQNGGFISAIIDDLSHFETCNSTAAIFTGVPAIDFSDAGNAQKLIVEACKEFGFFKAINHGVSMDFLNVLESESINFFRSANQEKQKSGPPSPFGYGNKKIGPKGDTGWVEYLLFSTNSNSYLPGISETLRCMVNEYVCIVRNMACKVLEMISDELKIGPKGVVSKMIGDERSDSCFRVNHYPPCPDLQALSGGNLIGFGEHTDPQIISVARSNNIAGLQICLRNGAWVSVPPDHTSFYFNVGDSLQVMTNGRLRSVKHRVLVDGLQSTLSIIFFGGPPLSQNIAPFSSLMEEDEESSYKEFNWFEYKKSAYNSRLGDNRLALFEKSSSNHHHSMVFDPKS